MLPGKVVHGLRQLPAVVPAGSVQPLGCLWCSVSNINVMYSDGLTCIKLDLSGSWSWSASVHWLSIFVGILAL